MKEDKLIEAIREIHNSRWDFAAGYNYLHYIDLDGGQASQDYSQYIRLSQQSPHPAEEGYSRLVFMKKTIENIYELIDTNLVVCLTSKNRYLREFSSLIARSN